MAKNEMTDGADAWRAYWGRGGVDDFSASGAAVSRALDAFWKGFLASVERQDSVVAVDLACGGGALLRRVLERLAPESRNGCALGFDLSLEALAQARLAAPGARLVAASLCSLPLPDRAATLVVSQHGVEYGGEAAFREAARILAPGGVFAAVIHDAAGGLIAECRHNLRFFEAFEDGGMLTLARTLLLGAPDPEKSRELAGRLAATSRSLAENDNGSAAFAFLRRVDADIRYMAPRRARYDRSAVERWLGNIESETNSYVKRIRGLMGAAKDDGQIAGVTAALLQTGLAPEPAERLRDESGGASAGWVVIARRHHQGDQRDHGEKYDQRTPGR